MELNVSMCKEWNSLIDFCFFKLALAVNVMPILQFYSWLVFYVCERSFFLDGKSQEEGKKKRKKKEAGIERPWKSCFTAKRALFPHWGLTSDFFISVYLQEVADINTMKHKYSSTNLVKHHKSSVSLSVRSFLWPTNGIKNK